ncbi:MAG: DUF4355 domain-containing protein [Deltaproteobacteria bacterium]|nr:DUF4355 domain-containing protein [Deltaproteobacteria bacterium]
MSALKREDYSDLSDEQWGALEADFDRARTQASDTARKKAEKEAAKNQETAISAAVEDMRKRIEMDETERLKADHEKAMRAIEEQRAELAADRKSLTATKKLATAGLPEDRIEELLPMFVGVDTKDLDTTLDGFIKTYQDTVKATVDAEKQKLLENATPAPGSTEAPIGVNEQAAEFLKTGDDAQAVQAMLDATPGAT